ncbi:hypothetical protein A9Q87_01445 [Flavobacteriales bacterium 34_180_T64]|nr:hypothetical protein A9Q87_01445 [Flavobacteriales bacterium 34_180_T64]
MKHTYLIAIPALLLAACGAPEEKTENTTTSSDATVTTLTSEKRDNYSPNVGDNYPQDVYFGDTHLHTSNSPDAGFFGTTLGPEDAYRYATGEEVVSSTGLKTKLIRPLDFLVIADHAEYFGIVPNLLVGNPELLKDPVGKRWYDTYKADPKTGGMTIFQEIVQSSTGETNEEMIKNPRLKRSTWLAANAVAEKYNVPGKFTAFLGYEWSSVIKGNNLHRVVVFKDGSDKANQIVPISSMDGLDPETLWEGMAAYEEKTGGQVLAIPHNGNWSNGMMFQMETVEGKPFDKAYAENRARWEPIYEVTQMKGDGEAHPILSPTDEFADFETWDKTNITARVPKTNEMIQTEYAREALKDGLLLEASLGINPFKFGLIGSTDAHTGLASTREDNNMSKMPHMEPSNHRATEPLIKSPVHDSLTYFGADISAAGLAAVWATENSREAIWDAMKRKEVYATTGNRLKVRVFGGWDFKSSDLTRPDFAKNGYNNGVPMGGDLSAADGNSPSFLVKAWKDVDGPNLDRVQMIKGWVGTEGKKHEKIYDLSVSDGRTIGKDGRCKLSVGSTVNIKEATYDNTIGDPIMSVQWTDPEFDAGQRAFYYVRVIEIPTPRWTAYDAKFYNIEMPEGTAMTVQDRAYTSPIWYTPK